MASASRRTHTPLIQQLQDRASRFDFMQAMRLLEQSLDTAENGQRRRPVGLDHAPSHEVVRLRSASTLRFPVGSIVKLQPERSSGAAGNGQARTESEDPPRLEMTVSFMGLTGANGVLPQHYTVRLIRALRDKELSTRDFFDLFNHRLISLFYRAAEKYCFPLAFERTRARRDGEDAVTRGLYSLVGLGTSGVRDRTALDDDTIVHYAGHYSRSQRSAVALELMLAERFGVPVSIQQFQGQWLELDRCDRSLMPSAAHPNGRNNQLGVSMIAGDRVWDVQSRFRVRLGPLSYEQFCRFTMMGEALGPMCSMIRMYVGPEFDFDVQPVLKAEEIPQSSLGGDPAKGARLGWTTWMGGGQSGGEDKDDFADAAFYVEQGAMGER